MSIELAAAVSGLGVDDLLEVTPIALAMAAVALVSHFLWAVFLRFRTSPIGRAAAGLLAAAWGVLLASFVWVTLLPGPEAGELGPLFGLWMLSGMAGGHVGLALVLERFLLGDSADESACTTCGYDLRGLAPGSMCPECGTRPARRDAMASAAPTRRVNRWIVRAAVLAPSLLCISLTSLTAASFGWDAARWLSRTAGLFGVLATVAVTLEARRFIAGPHGWLWAAAAGQIGFIVLAVALFHVLAPS